MPSVLEEIFTTPLGSMISPMPSALIVNAPNTDHTTTANIIRATATKPIQAIGVVIGRAVSNFSGERNLFKASWLKIESLPRCPIVFSATNLRLLR